MDISTRIENRSKIRQNRIPVELLLILNHQQRVVADAVVALLQIPVVVELLQAVNPSCNENFHRTNRIKSNISEIFSNRQNNDFQEIVRNLYYH